MMGGRRYVARNLGSTSICPTIEPAESGVFWAVWRTPLP
jgi:hypothetical protein